MIKKALHTLALISCFLGITSITGCTDGVYTTQGYPEQDGYDEDQTPAVQQPQQQNAPTPAFIQRILNEDDMTVPPPPPPKPAPKRPEPDVLDAS